MGRNRSKWEAQKRERERTARRRLDDLLAAARAEALDGRTDLADRYALLMRRLAMRHQVGLPPAARASVCRACSRFLVPDHARTRIRRGRVVTTCLRCGTIRRRPTTPRSLPASPPAPSPAPK